MFRFHDSKTRSENFQLGWHRLGLSLLSLSVPLLVILSSAIRGPSKSIFQTVLGSSTTECLSMFMSPIHLLSDVLPEPYGLLLVLGLIVASVVFLFAAKWHSRLKPTLTKKQKRSLQDVQNYIEHVVKPKKQQLYQEYLRQSVADYDF